MTNWTRASGHDQSKQHWISATAVVLEYGGSDLSDVAITLNRKATDLGYAHLMIDGQDRYGKHTIAIVFPLTESINWDQYTRLSAVLSEELGQYRAADGNMSGSHLVHIEPRSKAMFFDGAVISPRHKISETKNLYQNMDPCRFEAGGKRALPHITEPTFTSHDGLFEWAPTPAEKAQKTADELLASIGVKLN